MLSDNCTAVALHELVPIQPVDGAEWSRFSPIGNDGTTSHLSTVDYYHDDRVGDGDRVMNDHE